MTLSDPMAPNRMTVRSIGLLARITPETPVHDLLVKAVIDAATDLDAFGETAKLSALNDRLGGKKASKIKELTAAVKRQKKRSAQSESQFDFSGDYVIRSSDDATDQIAICLRALEDQGKKHDPGVFIRPDNLPGRIGKGGVVSLPTPRALRPILTDMVQYYTAYETRPPKRDFIKPDLADHVFFSPQLEEVLPPLKKVVTIPIFDKDGNLRTKKGYLPSIATYVAPDIDVGEINGDDYEEAVAYVFNEVVPDFPFCDCLMARTTVCKFSSKTWLTRKRVRSSSRARSIKTVGRCRIS